MCLGPLCVLAGSYPSQDSILPQRLGCRDLLFNDYVSKEWFPGPGGRGFWLQEAHTQNFKPFFVNILRREVGSYHDSWLEQMATIVSFPGNAGLFQAGSLMRGYCVILGTQPPAAGSLVRVWWSVLVQGFGQSC